jgi:hypothetical protein
MSTPADQGAWVERGPLTAIDQSDNPYPTYDRPWIRVFTVDADTGAAITSASGILDAYEPRHRYIMAERVAKATGWQLFWPDSMGSKDFTLTVGAPGYATTQVSSKDLVPRCWGMSLEAEVKLTKASPTAMWVYDSGGEGGTTRWREISKEELDAGKPIVWSGGVVTITSSAR